MSATNGPEDRAPEPGRHLAIVGVTASGKSELAMCLAERAAAAGRLMELVSIDSMQVYRGMDVGTAKPSADERARVRHHLLDLVNPDEEFSVARFRREADAAVAGIEDRGGRAVLVGGTGLYHRAVVDRLEIPGRFPEVLAELEGCSTGELAARLAEADPKAAARIEPGNRRRFLRALEVTIGAGRPFSSFGPGLEDYPATPYVLVGIRVSRDVAAERIARRFEEQLAGGFLDECRRLLDGPAPGRTAGQALGYRELWDHLQGRCTLEEAVEAAVTHIRKTAVRQERWFRRDPRITWFDRSADVGELAARVEDHWTAEAAKRNPFGA